MIRGIHGLFYSSDPDATRAFFREKVRLPGNDIGEGWWIFDLAEGDLGVHPVEDHGYGLVTYFEAPGGITVQLYEPRYAKGASRRPAKASRPARKAARKAARSGRKAARRVARKARRGARR